MAAEDDRHKALAEAAMQRAASTVRSKQTEVDRLLAQLGRLPKPSGTLVLRP